MKQKNQYVKKQHFIPQFSIRPFEVVKGECLTINSEQIPLKAVLKKTADVMQEIDLYESKDSQGNYIERNEIEDIYSKFEDDIAKKFKPLIELLLSNETNTEFKNMIKTNEWASKEAALLTHIALTFIRSPQIRSLVYENKDIPEFMKTIIYRQITTSQKMAVDHAKKHLNGEQLEVALHFLKDNNDSVLSIIFQHLMNNYQLEMFKTSGQEKFFLGDNPILVNKLEEIDYLIPIDPNLCLGTTKLKFQAGHIMVHSSYNFLDDIMVKKINEFTVKNARKTIIVTKKQDLDIVKQTLELS